MKYETKLEAAQAWVSGFNAIPQSFIMKAYDMDFFYKVDVLATPHVECENCDEIVTTTNGVCDECGSDEVENTYELPMWGTMWTFGESIDDEWARNNAEKLAECGFFVYESDDLGVFIGIDGAGYDFYEAHWIPLYEARGLQWHK